jgi:hypothetical protein
MPDTDISPGTALSYPYIHPRNIDHLKAALFYWDRVRRIVPWEVLAQDGHADGDSGDARELTDRGLLVATEPALYAAGAAQKFFDHIEPQSSRFHIDLNEAHDLARRNPGIHIEKLGYGVFERLRELGLARQIGSWVSMRDEVSAFYMFCLASEMGTKMSAPLLSDSPDDAALGQSLFFEPDSPADTSDVLLRIGIKLPSPEALRNIPTRIIADFAINRAAERQAFRETVQGIVDTARAARDPNSLEDYLRSQRTIMTRAISDYRKTIDELHVGGVASFAKLTVPTGLAIVLGTLFAPVPAAILGATGLAILGVSVFAETRGKLREAKLSQPLHFMTSVEKKFGGLSPGRRRPLTSIRRLFHRKN